MHYNDRWGWFVPQRRDFCNGEKVVLLAKIVVIRRYRSVFQHLSFCRHVFLRSFSIVSRICLLWCLGKVNGLIACLTSVSVQHLSALITVAEHFITFQSASAASGSSASFLKTRVGGCWDSSYHLTCIKLVVWVYWLNPFSSCFNEPPFRRRRLHSAAAANGDASQTPSTIGSSPS